jgi:uncharacterized protein YihD (DUF1040 family)
MRTREEPSPEEGREIQDDFLKAEKGMIMRDPKRITKLLKLFAKIWSRYPDMRLCQMIVNAVPNDSVLYYLEDDELIKILESFYSMKEKKD